MHQRERRNIRSTRGRLLLAGTAMSFAQIGLPGVAIGAVVRHVRHGRGAGRIGRTRVNRHRQRGEQEGDNTRQAYAATKDSTHELMNLAIQ